MNPIYAFLVTNLVTGLVMALVVTVFGFVWYGPLFGTRFGAIVGMSPAKDMSKEANKAFQKQMLPTYALSMIASFVLFFALAYFTVFIGPMNTSSAALYSLFIWAGFIVPTLASSALWSGKNARDSWHLFLITSGFNLVTCLVGGVAWSFVYPIFL